MYGRYWNFVSDLVEGMPFNGKEIQIWEFAAMLKQVWMAQFIITNKTNWID